MNAVIRPAGVPQGKRFRHDEAVSCPQAGFLGIVILRLKTGKVVRMEYVIRRTPIAGEGADRVFDHPGSISPFAYISSPLQKLDGGGQAGEALVLEPAGTGNGDIGAGRKGEDDLVFPTRRKPAQDVRTVTLDINALCFEAAFGPWLHHVPGVVEQGKNQAGHSRPLGVLGGDMIEKLPEALDGGFALAKGAEAGGLEPSVYTHAGKLDRNFPEITRVDGRYHIYFALDQEAVVGRQLAVGRVNTDDAGSRKKPVAHARHHNSGCTVQYDQRETAGENGGDSPSPAMRASDREGIDALRSAVGRRSRQT